MENLMRYISRTSRLAEMYRSKKLKPYGLGGMHHTYILNICRNPGVSQDQLAEIIYVNKSNVARQLAILEKEKYIRREKSPTDGRKLLIYPTEKAQEVYPKIVDILKEWNQMLLEDYDKETQEILGDALSEMMERAKTTVDKM